MVDFAANDTELMSRMGKIQRVALMVGIGATILSIIGVVGNRQQFFQSYIYAYIYWLNLSLGCVSILMLHHMVSSRWGFVTQRILEAGARTLPFMALLFIPLLFGLSTLYPWTWHASDTANWGVLHVNDREDYLNVPFFIIRAIVYFATWIGATVLLTKWTRVQDRTGDPMYTRKLRMLSAPGLIVFVLTVTFASIDWIMSLHPDWVSSIYGFIVVVGQVLAAFALVIVVAGMLSSRKPLSDVITPRNFHQLGNMLMTFVILWAYTAYAQWVIIWAGNLPDEISWYLPRLAPGWKTIALVLIVFHFFVPFLLLLSRQTKRTITMISAVAIGIIVVRLVDLFWFITPAFYPQGFHIHWLDITLPIAIGGLWVRVFVWNLKRQHLLPLHDPRFVFVPEHSHHVATIATAGGGEK